MRPEIEREEGGRSRRCWLQVEDDRLGGKGWKQERRKEKQEKKKKPRERKKDNVNQKKRIKGGVGFCKPKSFGKNIVLAL